MPVEKKNNKCFKEQKTKRVTKKDSFKKERADVTEKVQSPKKKITSGCFICQECKCCSGQQESYEMTVNKKQMRLEELLGQFCNVQPLLTMEKPVHYKNKVQRIFHHERNGAPICGYFSPEESSVIKVENCYIEDEKSQAIIDSIKGLLKSFKIKTYDTRTGYGLLRYVTVRHGYETGEIMVVLVLSSMIMPSKNNFVKALRKLHPEIDTILINENYRNTGSVYGEKETTIFGKGFILDTLCGKTFRISTKSNYPLNPVQSKKVYDTILSWCEFTGNELVLDAYCGIGTIGILASDFVRKVISVESKPEIVRDAISNIRRNRIKNVDVYTNDATEFVLQVAQSEKTPIDVAIVDPPYIGSGTPFIHALLEANPKKIVYVSRNPVCLAKEIKLLENGGYQVQKAVGVDILPWTEHVETIVLLSRR